MNELLAAIQSSKPTYTKLLTPPVVTDDTLRELTQADDVQQVKAYMHSNVTTYEQNIHRIDDTTLYLLTICK